MIVLSTTAAIFLAFVAAMATGVVSAAFVYLERRMAAFIAVALATWLIYVGALSASGFLANPAMRPPGAVFILGPVIVFVIFGVVRGPTGRRVALALPLTLLIGAQTFRVGVELFFHQLYIEGLAPRMLTFEGANIDIFVGASSPLVAWISTRGWSGRVLTLAWSVIGLMALANIAIRAVLTTPGPLHFVLTEPANLSVGTFPFTYIAGFFAPLAVILHVLALHALLAHRGVSSRTQDVTRPCP